VKRRQRGLMLSFIAMVFVSLGNKIMSKLETVSFGVWLMQMYAFCDAQ
jgi:hypothetical protein